MEAVFPEPSDLLRHNHLRRIGAKGPLSKHRIETDTTGLHAISGRRQAATNVTSKERIFVLEQGLWDD